MSIVLNGTSQFAKLLGITPPAAITIAGWFKAGSLTASGILAAADNAAAVGYKWLASVDASGAVAGDPVRANTYNGSTVGAAATTTRYSTGVWQHFCGVFANSSSRSAFLDGSSKGTDTAAVVGAANEYTVGVRRTESPTAYFKGSLAHVAVWDVALSDPEVAQLAAGVLPTSVQAGHLIEYWTLVSDGTAEVGGDLTLVGSPSFAPTDDPLFLDASGGLPIPVQLTDIPEPKASHGFEELDGLIYAVCGGTTGGHSKTAYVYDPDADSWTQIADAPIEVQSPCLRAVNGKLYLIGGHNSHTHVYYDTVYEYDPDLDTWTLKSGHMPTAMEDMASAVVDGKIYIFGGITSPPMHTIIQHVYVYDPVADSWETRTWSLPRALGDFGVEYNGKVYLVGAVDNMAGYVSPTSVDPTNIVNEYDPDTNVFTVKSPCPELVCYHEVEEIEGILYVFSGSTTDFEFLDVDQVYDVANDAWKSRPNLSYSTFESCLAAYNGSIYISGGADAAFNLIGSMYRFDPILSSDMSSCLGDLDFVPEPEPANSARYSAFNRQIDQDRS